MKFEKVLFIGDLHFTDTAKDRFKIFDVINKVIDAEKPDGLVFLGDITDKKDNHSNDLTLNIFKHFEELNDKKCLDHIYILQGNHDLHPQGKSILSLFTNFSKTCFIDDDTSGRGEVYVDDGNFVFIPNIHKPLSVELAHSAKYPSDKVTIAVMHHLFNGVKDPNGKVMPIGSGNSIEYVVSLLRKSYPNLQTIISGDIHNPQTIQWGDGNELIYVGSPYGIRYGDKWQPRFYLVNTADGTHKSIPIATDALIYQPIYIDIANAEEVIETIKDYGLNRKCYRIKFRYAVTPRTPKECEEFTVFNNFLINKLKSFPTLVYEGYTLSNHSIYADSNHKSGKFKNKTYEEILGLFIKENNLDNNLSSIGKRCLDSVSKD